MSHILGFSNSQRVNIIILHATETNVTWNSNFDDEKFFSKISYKFISMSYTIVIKKLTQKLQKSADTHEIGKIGSLDICKSFEFHLHVKLTSLSCGGSCWSSCLTRYRSPTLFTYGTLFSGIVAKYKWTWKWKLNKLISFNYSKWAEVFYGYAKIDKFELMDGWCTIKSVPVLLIIIYNNTPHKIWLYCVSLKINIFSCFLALILIFTALVSFSPLTFLFIFLACIFDPINHRLVILIIIMTWKMEKVCRF